MSGQKSQSRHTSAEGGGLEKISSDHISETTWNKGLFLCVFIVTTIDYSDEVSSKSEGVTWGPLVNLTWNCAICSLD